jgi:hypothetical protein
MEDQREKTDLSLFYRAAKETGVLDLALREILPLGKKENLLKLQRDLCLCGEMADLPGIFSGLSPEMARDPEVQKTALRNHYFLDDYDGILARAEAVARAQEEGSRSQLEAKLIWAKALETREKPEEAERIYQEVLNQQGVASDQELSARFGLFRIMLSRDKAGIALDRALRFLKPSIRKSAGTTELFAYLGQLMEAAPKEQAAEIGLLIEEHLGAFAFALQMIPEKLKEDKPDLDELFEIHLKMGGGPLLSALSTLLPLARKAGAAPNLQEITAQLTKEFKEKS